MPLKVRALKDEGADAAPRPIVPSLPPDEALPIFCMTVTGLRVLPPVFPIFREAAAGLFAPGDARFRETADAVAPAVAVDPICRFNMDLAPA